MSYPFIKMPDGVVLDESSSKGILENLLFNLWKEVLVLL